MSIHALAIHPAPPDWIPDSTLESFLREAGFLGDEFDLYGSRCFRPGARFFEHIIFDSSHSVVELTPTESGILESEPRDSRNVCQIKLESAESTDFLCGCNMRDPKCPACSRSITAWPEMLGKWLTEHRDWSCPACGHSCKACDVNWQHVAGAARYMITVRQIYEGEARPADSFLRCLSQQTSCAWRYFWYHL